LDIVIKWLDSERLNPRLKALRVHVQLMVNRLLQGTFRYGPPAKDHNYMTRMLMEMKAYKRTGNREHLLNISNYCVLETIAPENSRFHFDNTAESATRSKRNGKD